MPRIQRITRIGLPILLVLAAACASGGSQERARLTAEESRLVNETLQRIRIRLEMTRDSARAAELQAAEGSLYTEEERQFLLDRLATHSDRAQLVVSALHDSLEALRTELFPSTAP